MYAVPDLDAAIEWAADIFDSRPALGGAHRGRGTRNALLSLGSTYLEIIAPDPAQQLEGNLGAAFANLTQGGLVTWAAQGDLDSTAQILSNAGISCRGPSQTERQDPQGQLLIWKLLFAQSNVYGARLPFFIDWLACEHPSQTNPLGGEFQSLEISTPDSSEYKSLLQSLGMNSERLNIDVCEGEPALTLKIACRRGEVTLQSTQQTTLLKMA